MNAENSKTLLLVEDEAVIALAQKMTLERYGYNVITASTGEKAIELFRNNSSIDLILMDIDLGKGIDGTETAELMLKEKHIPVVFLSSHTEPKIVEKTEAVTSYGYVVKNSGITVLDTSIKMAFKLFEANNNIRAQKMEIEAAYEEMQASNEELEAMNAEMLESEKRLIQSETSTRSKLKAILEPEGDIGALDLADIIDVPAIQFMMEDFYRLTGILGAVLDISGTVLVAAGWQDICTKFHRCNPETRKNCIESDTILSRGIPVGRFKTYRCRNNMWDMATPIEVGGKHVGNVYIGQFFYEEEVPDIEMFRSQARKYGFNEKDYLEAVGRVPHLSRERVETAMSFYSKIAMMISTLSYSTIQLNRKIYENKQTEDMLRRSEEKFRTLYENMVHGVFYQSADGTLTDINPAGLDMFGITRDQFLGRTSYHPEWKVVDEEYRILKPEEHPSMAALKSAKDVDVVVGVYNPAKKEYRWLSVSAKPQFRPGDEKPDHVFVTMHDVTEHRTSEIKTEHLYKEKELLLKEVHHRIKNFMNTIYGLLSLQAESLEDRPSVAALEDAGNRIKSMMLLYDKLYRSPEYSNIPAGDYLSSLVDEILLNFPDSGSITVQKSFDNFILDVKKMQPLGIIVNELLTNTMKYAFKGRAEGVIALSASRSGNHIKIIIRDNGAGIPESVNFENSTGLGLQLVRMLTEQIDGSITIERDKGTKFVLEFEV